MKKFISILLFGMIIMTACTPSVSGSGDVLEREFDVESVSDAVVSGAFDVYVRQSSVERLMIKADDNFFEFIEVDVRSNGVEIEMERIPRNITALEIYIETSDLQKLQLNGAIDLEARNLEGEHLEIQANGASNLRIDLEYDQLKLELNGASEVELEGRTELLKAYINGASDLFAFPLKTKDCKIEVNGAGTAEVWAKKSLNVNVQGAGSIKYKGNPDLNQSITGAGSVKRMDE